MVLQPGDLRSFKKLFPITEKRCLERDMNQIFGDSEILLVENLAYSEANPPESMLCPDRAIES